MAISLACFTCSGLGAAPVDPCPNKDSSTAELEECYSRAQARINTEADTVARNIAVEFRKEADQASKDGPVIAGLMRKTANAVEQSQRTWKQYRNQYCDAIMYSYDLGSAAGGAHESCMYQLGEERLRELRTQFSGRGAD
jgi:uncharacterized protein YecT (DUF1311 family)